MIAETGAALEKRACWWRAIERICVLVGIAFLVAGTWLGLMGDIAAPVVMVTAVPFHVLALFLDESLTRETNRRHELLAMMEMRHEKANTK